MTNQFVALDATHVYSQAGTSYYTAPAWPSLWMTYVRRELSGPAPPYPAIADARLGNATSVGLQSPGFSVAPGQVYTHVTKHGIVSGCISPPPAEFPQILSTQTETVTRTNQTVTTSPPGLTVSVVAQPCQGPCTYDWLIGAGIGYSVAAADQIFGGVQYQFANWSNGATSAFVYRPPSTPSTLTANYTIAVGPYPVSGAASPASSGAVSPATGSYTGGSMVTFQASPASGYLFDYWTIVSASGTSTSTINPLTMMVSSAIQAVASFRTATAGSVSCSAVPNPAITGSLVTLTATTQGISQPSYSWTGVVTGSQSSVSFTPSQAGGYMASVSVNGLTASCYVAVADQTLATFRNCLQSGATGNTCELPPGIHIVPPLFGTKASNTEAATQSYLHIGRSSITIKGTLVSGSTDTILRRGRWFSGSLTPPWPPTIGDEFIMEAPSSVTDVTIRDLMFDGNRYLPGLNCLPVDESARYRFFDLEVSRGGKFTLESLQFINSPGSAVNIGGNGSVIELCTFGHGYTPPAGVSEAALTGPQTATRFTAIYMKGTGTVARYNSIHYAGTAGINLSGTHQLAYGNTLFSNRYEIADGSGGGQLYLEGGSSDAIVAGNVIYGGQWPPAPTVVSVAETQCALPSVRQFNSGIEGYGYRHYFFNNEVADHTGTGMQFAGSNPTEDITISSASYDPEDTTRRFTEGNSDGGIVFHDETWCSFYGQTPCHIAQGVTLDAVLVAKNRRASAVLAVNNSSKPNNRITDRESIQPIGAKYSGFYNGSCITGNTDQEEHSVDTPVVVTPTGGTALDRPQPSSLTSYFPQSTQQPCPSPPWPTSIPPAAPYRPGWP